MSVRTAGWMALVPTLAFVVVASRHIMEPGTYPDEFFQILPALSFIEGGLATNALPATGPVFSIGEHELALMTASYSGQVKTIAFIPVVALFDISATSLRYVTIAVAALALLATYAFARRLFRSEAIALVAVLLLAFDPGLVFYARTDYGQSVFMMLARAVALWQLLRWWDTRSTGSLALGMFALGVGLYDKFIFIWVIWGLAVAGAIVAGRAIWRRLDRRTVAIGAGAFAVGSLPLIVYELRSGLGTLDRYDEISGTQAGSDAFPLDEPVVPSGGFFDQFGQRVRVLGDLMDGSTVSRLIDAPFPTHVEVMPVLVGVAAVAICVQLVVRRPPTHELRAGAFVLLVPLVVLICTALTDPGFHGHHVLLTYPFPHLAVALVLVQAARAVSRAVPAPRQRAVFVSAIAALTAIPLAFSVVTTAGMVDSIPDASGRGSWSTEIYDVESYLSLHHREKPLVTADWGITYQLVALSQGKLHSDDVALQLEDPASPSLPAALLEEPLHDRRTLYVLRSPFATVNQQARETFFATLDRLGYRPTLVRTFEDRRGTPQFEVYSAREDERGA